MLSISLKEDVWIEREVEQIEPSFGLVGRATMFDDGLMLSELRDDVIVAGKRSSPRRWLSAVRSFKSFDLGPALLCPRVH